LGFSGNILASRDTYHKGRCLYGEQKDDAFMVNKRTMPLWWTKGRCLYGEQKDDAFMV